MFVSSPVLSYFRKSMIYKRMQNHNCHPSTPKNPVFQKLRITQSFELGKNKKILISPQPTDPITGEKQKGRRERGREDEGGRMRDGEWGIEG